MELLNKAVVANKHSDYQVPRFAPIYLFTNTYTHTNTHPKNKLTHTHKKKTYTKYISGRIDL